MRNALPFVFFTLLSPALSAQSQVVPERAATRPGNDVYPVFWGSTFRANEARTQVVYDASHLAPGTTIRSLQFRASASSQSANQAALANMTVDMSTSAVDPAAISDVFDDNHGADRTTVFQGAAVLPGQQSSGSWPEPWEAPVVFSQPFVVSGSQPSLVVEFVVDGNTSGSSWWVEAYERDDGDFSLELQSQCLTSGGVPVNAYSFKPWGVVPGGSFRMGFAGYPNQEPNMAVNALVFGTQGVGGTFAGRTLPFELSSVGMPAGPGCQWAIDHLASMPITYLPGPNNKIPNLGWLYMQNGIPIPNNPGFANCVFYAQCLAWDSDGFGGQTMHTSGAVRIRVGDGIDVPAAMLITTGDNAAPTGTVRTSRALALRLNP